jgi:hypothetical protein
MVGTAMAGERLLGWRATDKSLALTRGNQVVWQLNFAERDGKPYFHPVRLPDGTDVTAERPADHPWHLGLWWSWKYINQVNYWEFNKKTGKYQGESKVTRMKITTNANHSAMVEFELSYNPPNAGPVLTEKRAVTVSAPDATGNYSIDWNATFTAGQHDVKLDRTPPSGVKGGVGWGGYAGLSVRFGNAARKWRFTSSTGKKGAKEMYGQPAAWMDFSGPAGGVAIFDSPQNFRHPTPWYPNQQLPYFSPAFLFRESYTLPAGKTLTLRYRVLVHGAGLDVAGEWKKFQ